MRELDKTSILLPFHCYYAARAPDYVRPEKTLRTAFGGPRIRSNREFFKLDPYRAKMVIELLAIEDVTPDADLFEGKESAEAIERATRTSGRYNFLKFGIAIGAELEYARDSAFSATVHDENSIMFQGEIASPSKAAVVANRMGEELQLFAWALDVGLPRRVAFCNQTFRLRER